jgi:hypothetical protein
MKLFSWQILNLKLFWLSKITSKFVKFKMQVLQTLLDAENIKIKLVELQKLRDFVVYNFFVWIYL